MTGHREYREEPLFRSQKYAIQPDAKVFESVLLAYGWMIAQNPTAYPVISGTPGWRRLRTRPVGDMPALDIYYSVVSDELCALEAVEVATDASPAGGFFDSK